MKNINAIIEILQSYELISKEESMLLAERMTVMCAAEEIEELFVRKAMNSNVIKLVK